MSLAFGVGNMTMKKIMVDKCELESQTVKKKMDNYPSLFSIKVKPPMSQYGADSGPKSTQY